MKWVTDRNNKPRLRLELWTSTDNKPVGGMTLSKTDALHLAYELLQAAVIQDNCERTKK